MSDPIRLIITMEGGCIQNIYTDAANPKRVTVKVIDFDVDGVDPEARAQYESKDPDWPEPMEFYCPEGHDPGELNDWPIISDPAFFDQIRAATRVPS